MNHAFYSHIYCRDRLIKLATDASVIFLPAVPDCKVQSFIELTGINTTRTSLSINTDRIVTHAHGCHVIHEQ